MSSRRRAAPAGKPRRRKRRSGTFRPAEGIRGGRVGHRTPRFQTSLGMEGDGGNQDREFPLSADGSTVAAIADAALAGEPVVNRRSENRNGGLGLATLVGEDHRDSQVERRPLPEWRSRADRHAPAASACGRCGDRQSRARPPQPPPGRSGRGNRPRPGGRSCRHRSARPTRPKGVVTTRGDRPGWNRNRSQNTRLRLR